LIKVLYFVLGVFIIVKILSPLAEEIKDIKKQIVLVDNSIKKNRFILQKQKEIAKSLDIALLREKHNREFFYPPSVKKSVVFTKIQTFIKKIANRYKIDINYIKWRNVKDDKFLKIYPVEVTIKTDPENFARFIDEICKSKKILDIKSIKINAINPRKDKIDYKIVFIGFQIKGK